MNKSDRNDARGIAQMMRVGLFKPMHVKTLAAHKPTLLTSRRLVQRKLINIESLASATPARSMPILSLYGGRTIPHYPLEEQ